MSFLNIIIFYLFTSIVFSHFSLATETKIIFNHLPSFDEMFMQPSSVRKEYLNELVKLINKKEYDFLDDILLVSGKKMEKHCFSGIYGKGSNIKNPYKVNRRACKQDMNLALVFFMDPKNRYSWERFRLKVGLMCLESKKCQKFLKKQQNFKKSFLKKHKM